MIETAAETTSRIVSQVSRKTAVVINLGMLCTGVVLFLGSAAVGTIVYAREQRIASLPLVGLATGGMLILRGSERFFVNAIASLFRRSSSPKKTELPEGLKGSPLIIRSVTTWPINDPGG